MNPESLNHGVGSVRAWGVLALGVVAVAPLMGLRVLQPQPTIPWEVPARAARKQNPQHADANSIATGKRLYERECVSCHGAKGLGDGPKAADLERPPGNLASRSMWDQSDGALFYKISEGRAPMPTTKALLSEEERWHVINYVRTLAPPPVAATPPQFDAPEGHRKAVSALFRAYQPVCVALAKGDGPGAAKGAHALIDAAGALKAVDPKTLPEAAQGPWKEDLDACVAGATMLKDAGDDLAKLRRGFGTLSGALVRVASRFGHDEKTPLLVFAPPRSSGADAPTWIQIESTAADPYGSAGAPEKTAPQRRLAGQRKP